MKLIVGLGNPGVKYRHTRHNVGFMFIDFYASQKNITDFKEKNNGLFAMTNINNEKVILLKPLSYMNLSGQVVQAFASYYNIANEDIIVVYDDMDLPFAHLRLRKKGNAGGHNGMKNIIAHLGSNEFYRVRVGIDKPVFHDTIDYVLSSFSKDEIAKLNDTFVKVSDTIDMYITNKFDLAMNKYNSEK